MHSVRYIVGIGWLLLALGCQAASSAPAPTAAPAPPPAPAAAAPTGPAPAAAVPPQVTLRVGDLRINSSVGTYLALERGYFAEQGINVEFLPFTTGGEQIPPLASEQLDVGVGAVAAALFNAVARGVPIKLVADQGRNLPNRSAAALALRKDLWDSGTVREIGQLRGRTIGITSTASSVEIQLDKGLARAGLGLADVNLTVMSFPDMTTAFANRAIDAGMYQEPLTTLGVESGDIVRWLRADELYPNQQNGVLMFSPTLAAQTDTARRYITAYLRGVRDYLAAFDRGEGREDVIRVLIAHTTVKDRDLYDKIILSGVGANGYLNVDSLRDDQQWFFDHGYLPQMVDLNTLVDHQFVDYALSVLGRVAQ